MAQTVSFKLPFDELRGKLATKQSGIIYSGQEVGANVDTLAAGKRLATNFDKYIVAYKRKGNLRFYVKSNTAINRTAAQVLANGKIALASALADYLISYPKESVLRILEALLTAYNAKQGTNQSLRGWIIGQLASQISTTPVLLGYTLPDYRTPGLYTKISVINRGITANEQEISISTDLAGGGALTSFDDWATTNFDVLDRKGVYNSIRMYRNLSGTGTVKVIVEGVEHTCYAPIMPNTRNLLVGNRQLDACGWNDVTDAEEQFVGSNVILFDIKTGKAIDGAASGLLGGEDFGLYTDSTLTTAYNHNGNPMPATLYAGPQFVGA